jgi:hypothetical protein
MQDRRLPLLLVALTGLSACSSSSTPLLCDYDGDGLCFPDDCDDYDAAVQSCVSPGIDATSTPSDESASPSPVDATATPGSPTPAETVPPEPTASPGPATEPPGESTPDTETPGSSTPDESSPGPGTPLPAILSLSEADYILRGEAAFDTLGRSIAFLGDLTGDGHSDVVLLAPGNDRSGMLAGTVYVLHGPDYDGLEDAQGRIGGEQTDGHQLRRVDTSGDYDGDGLNDLVIGVSIADDNGKNAGAVYVFKGPAGGDATIASASIVIYGEAEGDNAGDASCAGDVDGDGHDDLLIGAPLSDAGGVDSGAVYLFRGPLEPGVLKLSDADARFIGKTAGDNATVVTTSPGDLNHDGFDDVLIGAPAYDTLQSDAGAVYVFFGPVSGAHGVAEADVTLLIPKPAAANELLGSTVALGDLDGDRNDDLIIGAPGADGNDGTTDQGAVLVMYGPLDPGTVELSSPDARILGAAPGDAAGTALAFAGDVNGDGKEDLLIGAPGNDDAGTDAGAAWLLYGPVIGTMSLSTAGLELKGEAAGDLAGSEVAAGDLDGDGLGEIMISAYNNGQISPHAGAVYILRPR